MKKSDPVVRQQQLLARSAELRTSAAMQAQNLKKPLALLDKARAGVQWVSHNRVASMGVGLALAVVLPKRTMLVWGGRLWAAWAAYNRLSSVVAPEPRRTRTSTRTGARTTRK